MFWSKVIIKIVACLCGVDSNVCINPNLGANNHQNN
jgi:hypothetical protein